MRHFDNQLQALLKQAVMMGSLAESMIDMAVKGLLDRNESQVGEVFAREKQVNLLQVELDDLAVKLTALQQPVARDARFLFMVSRIGGELERIGDQAVNICQNTHHVLAPPSKAVMLAAAVVDLPMMAELARKMVRDSLVAMMRKDVELANRVLEDDRRVNAFRDQMFRSLLTDMKADPEAIQQALSLILIARNLERIGDHATNIGEEVIYWVQGRDVRHGAGLEVRRAADQPAEADLCRQTKGEVRL